MALPSPVELREVVELIELILSGLSRTQTSYYFDAAKKRLKAIEERLT